MAAPIITGGPAGAPDVDDVVTEILAEAFVTDPLTAWIYPDKTKRRVSFGAFCARILEHPGARSHRLDLAGAAIWLHAGDHADHSSPTPEPDPVTPAGRLAKLGRALEASHPSDRMYSHLFFLGVVERQRGSGSGTLLLRHGLAEADARGLGAYLEASSAQNRALYRRYGFEDRGASVRVDDSPEVWPMWREPRGA